MTAKKVEVRKPERTPPEDRDATVPDVREDEIIDSADDAAKPR